MSDPFERLRNPDTSSIVPDVAALKSRARRIERRRQMLLGAGALAVAIVAVAGIALSGGNEPTQLAEEQRERSAPTPAAALEYGVGGEAAPTPELQEQQSATTTTGGASTGRAAPKSGEAPTAGADLAAVSAPPLEATIDVREATLIRATQLKLTVCNTSPNVVKRTFGTSQRYDFEVWMGGNVVWRWSQDRMFTQVVGQETWKLNECKSWTEEWNGTTSSGVSAAPGDYQAIGVLKTSPELKTKAKTFCYASC